MHAGYISHRGNYNVYPHCQGIDTPSNQAISPKWCVQQNLERALPVYHAEIGSPFIDHFVLPLFREPNSVAHYFM
jgi:hypothetical protein